MAILVNLVQSQCSVLSVHSKPQQYKIAKYCEDVLGDLLLTKSLSEYPVSDGHCAK